MSSCMCSTYTDDSVPFAHRPTPNMDHSSTLRKFTDIKEILHFRHSKSTAMTKPEDIPVGEGQFLVQWKTEEGCDWIHSGEVFKFGLIAIRRYFDKRKEERRVMESNFMKKLTHISSLYDIVCGNIECERENEYKLKIGGLTDEFLFELNHPVWGEKITKLFEIVRENGSCYVWVNRFQLKHIFRSCVEAWEKKGRTHPTTKEIENMGWFEYGQYLKRKDEGYYTEEKGETSTEEVKA